MTQPVNGRSTVDDGRRKAVRRTVIVLVSIVLAFFALSFVQIVLMK